MSATLVPSLFSAATKRMSRVKPTPIHWGFWLVGGFAVIWNALGGVNFYMQLTFADLSFMPEWWQNVAQSRPDWATGAMAVGVFGGVLGGVLLLLKKRAAYYVFIFSLVGTLVTLSHAIGIDGAGPRQIFEGLIMPVAVAFSLIFYTKMAVNRRWLS